jgi:hypothetical protein
MIDQLAASLVPILAEDGAITGIGFQIVSLFIHPVTDSLTREADGILSSYMELLQRTDSSIDNPSISCYQYPQ